jgi:uncharacterized membrane protein YoaK (UPF0700 family)
MVTNEEHKATIAATSGLPARGRVLSPVAVRDGLLVALAFGSGAVDAISWLVLGKIFTAFMTGNIVFLGLGVVGAGGLSIPHVAVSLAAFAVGVLLAVPIVKPSRGTGVWPRRVSIVLGISALAQAAFLAVWVATSGEPSTIAAYPLIGLSALAMGLESGAIMSLDVRGVSNTAATATVVDLLGDVAGWPQAGMEKVGLTTVLLGLLAGAIAGAALVVHARVYAPVLPLAATVLVIAAASIALKPAR